MNEIREPKSRRVVSSGKIVSKAPGTDKDKEFQNRQTEADDFGLGAVVCVRRYHVLLIVVMGFVVGLMFGAHLAIYVMRSAH